MAEVNEEQNRVRQVPSAATVAKWVEQAKDLDRVIDTALETYAIAMRDHRLHEGLDAAMSIVRAANGFIDAEQPWKLAKDPDAGSRLDDVLGEKPSL